MRYKTAELLIPVSAMCSLNGLNEAAGLLSTNDAALVVVLLPSQPHRFLAVVLPLEIAAVMDSSDSSSNCAPFSAPC